jgi:hypothetical protein
VGCSVFETKSSHIYFLFVCCHLYLHHEREVGEMVLNSGKSWEGDLYSVRVLV